MLAALKPVPVADRPSARHEFRIISDLGGLEALEDEWNALFARVGDSRLGFQTHGWTVRWARHFARQGELHIVAARANGRLQFVWPLITRRTWGVTTLEHLGEPLCQYHGAIIDPDAPERELVAAAIAHLKALGCDLLRLRRLRADSRLTEALLGAGAEIARAVQAPHVDLRNGRLARGEGVRGKAASNRRRRLRKLEELGSVRFERAACPVVATRRLEAAIALKRAWAMKSGRLARAVFDPRFESVFRDALAGRDPFAHLRVYSLLIDERPIGVEISIVCGGRLFGHLLAHDPELAAFGIGAALADASIRAAAAEGRETFDLLTPADPYKRAFSDGETDVYDLNLPLTSRGRVMGRLRDRLDRALRALAARAPASLVREALVRFAPASRH